MRRFLSTFREDVSLLLFVKSVWALLHFLKPQVFTEKTLAPFRAAFDLSLGVYDQTFLAASRKLLEIAMLRRTKDDVKLELSVPPREELTRLSCSRPCHSDGSIDRRACSLRTAEPSSALVVRATASRGHFMC